MTPFHIPLTVDLVKNYPVYLSLNVKMAVKGTFIFYYRIILSIFTSFQGGTITKIYLLELYVVVTYFPSE
jgi:hypothetical protein